MTTEPIATHTPRACDAALSRAFSFLGKRWSGIILGTLANGAAGFTELRRSIVGISDSMLSERLAELTRCGIVERSVDVGPPVSVEYRLTESGQALAPALHELSRWAQENLTSSDAVSSS